MKRLPSKNAKHGRLEIHIGGVVWKLTPFLMERRGSTRTNRGSCQLKEPPIGPPLLGQVSHKIVSFLRLSIHSSRTKLEVFWAKLPLWGKSPWHTLELHVACLLPWGDNAEKSYKHDEVVGFVAARCTEGKLMAHTRGIAIRIIIPHHSYKQVANWVSTCKLAPIA